MNIFIFTGYAGAGKSTLGRKMSEFYHLDFIEHQPMMHRLAVAKGYRRTRHWLADIGVEKFVEDSTEEMIRLANEVKDRGSKGIIFDVGYGEHMLQKFKESFPGANIYIISVNLESQLRGERIINRMSAETIEEAQKEREFRDDFLTKAGVESIIARADILVTNRSSIKETFDQLTKELEFKGLSL